MSVRDDLMRALARVDRVTTRVLSTDEDHADDLMALATELETLAAVLRVVALSKAASLIRPSGERTDNR